MQPSDYESVSQAASLEEFRNSLSHFAALMGFPLVNALLVQGDLESDTLQIGSIGNTPSSFLMSHSDLCRIRVDPVMHRLMDPTPFAWDQQFYAKAGKGHLWEMGAPHGYRVGIAASLAISPRQRVFVGVDRHEALSTSTQMKARYFADIQLLAIHAHLAAKRLLDQSRPAKSKKELSELQLTVLELIAEGKSSWAISKIRVSGFKCVGLYGAPC